MVYFFAEPPLEICSKSANLGRNDRRKKLLRMTIIAKHVSDDRWSRVWYSYRELKGNDSDGETWKSLRPDRSRLNTAEREISYYSREIKEKKIINKRLGRNDTRRRGWKFSSWSFQWRTRVVCPALFPSENGRPRIRYGSTRFSEMALELGRVGHPSTMVTMIIHTFLVADNDG